MWQLKLPPPACTNTREFAKSEVHQDLIGGLSRGKVRCTRDNHLFLAGLAGGGSESCLGGNFGSCLGGIWGLGGGF